MFEGMYIGIDDLYNNHINCGDVVYVEGDTEWVIEYACFGEPKFMVTNNINSCRDILLDNDTGLFYFYTDGSSKIFLEVQQYPKSMIDTYDL